MAHDPNLVLALQVCQRLGTILCHTPVRDGAAKGKIERFFRTVRETFLTRKLDLGSLDSDELSFVERDRSVLADNTFSLKNTRFEAPRDLRSA